MLKSGEKKIAKKKGIMFKWRSGIAKYKYGHLIMVVFNGTPHRSDHLLPLYPQNCAFVSILIQ